MSENNNIIINNHGKFWLTLGSLISLIFTFSLVVYFANNNYFENNMYGILFIPYIIYQIIQFMVNYLNLTEHDFK